MEKNNFYKNKKKTKLTNRTSFTVQKTYLHMILVDEYHIYYFQNLNKIIFILNFEISQINLKKSKNISRRKYIFDTLNFTY